MTDEPDSVPIPIPTHGVIPLFCRGSRSRRYGFLAPTQRSPFRWQ
ncbi:hypothetical protein ACMA1I_06090 [Pontibacter sp. 13R65]